MSCRNTVPNMQTLLTHLEDEIQRFEQAIQDLPEQKVAN